MRQQRRQFPLDATRVDDLWVPTPEETLRLKAWMIADRGATRDFLDVAALGDLLGPERSAVALASLSDLYDAVGTETATMRFAQAAMTRPIDEQDVDLRAYRGLVEPYRDLDYVVRRVREIALPALERELGVRSPAPGVTAPDVTPPAPGQRPDGPGTGRGPR